MEKRISPLIIENAQLMFLNFEGRPDRFNTQGGIRTFNVALDAELADRLAADGWNVRWLQPRDEEDDPTPILQVKVNFAGKKPPKIVMVSSTSRKKTYLTEETVHILDWAEIVTADVEINPYVWEANGKGGIKGYLNVIYVTIVEDAFASKYDDLTDGG